MTKLERRRRDTSRERPGAVGLPPSPRDEGRALAARLSRLVRLGIVLALAASAGSLLVGALSYRAARDQVVEKLHASHLDLARLLAHHADEHAGGPRDRRQIAESVLGAWTANASLYPGRYVCLVDQTGRILMNTGRPDVVGRDASEIALAGPGTGGPATVGGLLREDGDWVGQNLNLSGKRQIVAYARIPSGGGLVAVHAPLEVVVAEIRAALLPFAAGLTVIALGAIPLSIGLLLWAFWRSQGAALRALEQQDRLRGELLQAQKMEAVGRLAGGIAHDFNNLMTAVLGYAELIEGRVRGDRPAEDDVREIKRAISRASDLTSQLLAFSRRQLLEPRPFDLNVVVGEMGGLVRRLIREDVELVLDIGADTGWVRADPGQIEQVLMNLVVNARDAMPDGGRITIETASIELDDGEAASFDGLAPGPHVRLTIRDTGPGMSRDVQRQAFDPFFTTKDAGKGTGLGLSTVYGIVKQSGGDVWIDSAPGLGTGVSIVLPEVAARPEEAAQRGPRREARVSGRGTILLVEDDEGVRNLVTKVLRHAGHDLIEAHGGREALRMWPDVRDRVDLVVTDVVMPGVGGAEVAERVKADRPECDVVFVSGYADQRGEELSERFPSSVSLQKPFTPSMLLGVVARLLTSRRTDEVAATIRPR